MPATCPHSALPSVIAPKNVVTNIASPRPRAHSGSATCAETLRLASTAIQDTPAMAHAVRAVTASPAIANKANVIAVPHVPAATRPSGPSLAFSKARRMRPRPRQRR